MVVDLQTFTGSFCFATSAKIEGLEGFGCLAHYDTSIVRRFQLFLGRFLQMRPLKWCLPVKLWSHLLRRLEPFVYCFFNGADHKVIGHWWLALVYEKCMGIL